MYTLHLARGTSGLAAHIVLEEIGAPYQTRFLSIPDKEHLSPDYLAINPRGRLPTLVTKKGALAENPAILAYLAQSHPDAGLMPTDPFAFAQAQSTNLYIASTMHVAFAHKARGARWADDAGAITAMQQKVPENVRECAQFIEDHLLHGPWALASGYSVCDAYLFLAHRWMAANDVPLHDFRKLAAHTEALRARGAVQRVLKAHWL